MPYTAQRVLLESPTVSVYQHAGGTTGFPSGSFSYALFSAWVCLGGGGPRTVGIYNSSTFISVVISPSSVEVIVNAGFNHVIFDGTYAVAVGARCSNILVSIAPVTQLIQVYVNDAPITRSSGGWTGSGSFQVTSGNQWDIDGSGAPGLADLFVAAPAAFYDLSIVANRRKFITSWGAPADLGANASSVLGVAPPIYLSVRPGNSANSFATNYGTGGAFSIGGSGTLNLQAPDVCFTPVPLRPTGSGDIDLATTSPGCTFYTTGVAVGVDENEWRLSVSDDGGRTWSTVVKPRSSGTLGQYRKRLRWLKMGQFRQRVVRLENSAKSRRNIVGIYLDVDKGMS